MVRFELTTSPFLGEPSTRLILHSVKVSAEGLEPSFLRSKQRVIPLYHAQIVLVSPEVRTFISPNRLGGALHLDHKLIVGSKARVSHPFHVTVAHETSSQPYCIVLRD